MSELEAGVKARVRHVEDRVAAACRRSGRARSEVVVIGASKRQPLAALAAAVEAGLQNLGENRVQEAEAKRGSLPAELTWHLIGPLQSNKARRAAEIFQVVHSVDRPKIAAVLDREAARLGKRLKVLFEVNLATEPSKHGFLPEELPAALLPLASFEHLEVRGLMAIPPPTPTAEGARVWHRRLRELRDQVAAVWPEAFPGELSMGMSADFEVAIEEGATYVRIGTELFGPRST